MGGFTSRRFSSDYFFSSLTDQLFLPQHLIMLASWVRIILPKLNGHCSLRSRTSFSFPSRLSHVPRLR